MILHPSIRHTAKTCILRIAFCSLLPHLASTGVASPSADEWSDRLAAARLELAKTSDVEERRKQADQRWLEFARDYPVAADWILQDLGLEAAVLLISDQAVAAENRLLAAATDRPAPWAGSVLAW